MAELGPYRGDKVHVLAEMCSTCIFRPGNLMELQSGRVRGMVDEAVRADSMITCHSTSSGADGFYEASGPAVCRGFFDRHSTIPLRLAQVMDRIEYDDPPCKVVHHG
jgi:hypothetical protein